MYINYEINHCCCCCCCSLRYYYYCCCCWWWCCCCCCCIFVLCFCCCCCCYRCCCLCCCFCCCYCCICCWFFESDNPSFQIRDNPCKCRNQSCPRVGWTRGSRFCRILAGRVESGQHFGIFSFLLIISGFLNQCESSNTAFGLMFFYDIWFIL